jgi:NAD-reducing hydrogenase large subunit
VLLSSLVQSHATSFFYLTAPDLVFGHAAAPELRNLFAMAEIAPELVSDGALLRSFGQQVVERLSGRRIHPAFVIPGGVTHPLDLAAHDALRALVPAAIDAAERSLAWWSERLPSWSDEVRVRGRERAFLAHRSPAGVLEHAGGTLRMATRTGALLDDEIPPAECMRRIHEQAVPWSHAKLCAWQSPGGRRGYEVGPLARLAIADRCGTPRADRALREFRRLAGDAPFHAHGARLVEILFALEHIAELLDDPRIVEPEVLALADRVVREEGVGACEAPRGALFHRYRVDEDGLVTGAALVAPTGQNARAMNGAVRDAVRRAMAGGYITTPSRNRIAAAVRSFDPCLSCATHSVEGSGVELQLVGSRGELLDVWPPAADPRGRAGGHAAGSTG